MQNRISRRQVRRGKIEHSAEAEQPRLHQHGLHQHVPLRVQSVQVVGGVNVLVDTAM